MKGGKYMNRTDTFWMVYIEGQNSEYRGVTKCMHRTAPYRTR